MTYPAYKEKTADVLRGCIYKSCLPSDVGIVPAPCASLREKRLPANVISVHCSKSTGLFFIFTEGGMYITYDNDAFILIDSARREESFMTEYADEGDVVCAAVAGSIMYLHGGSSFTSRVLTKPVSCGLYRRGRFFGALKEDKNRIVWSRPDEIYIFEGGIDGGGYADLSPSRGNVLNMCEYSGKLVAVREYGLSVISAYGSPENFAEEITDTDCAKTYKNTVAAAGGKLVFLTEAGLCVFDGSRISTLNLHGIENPVCAAACGNIYLLACECEKAGGRTVLYYDVEKGISCFIDVAADALCVKDRAYIYSGDRVYALEDGGKYECASRFDFGTGKNKTLTQIDVGGVADLEISNGRVSRVFKGVSGKVRPRMRGKSFTLKICAESALEYVNATAEVSVGI